MFGMFVEPVLRWKFRHCRGSIRSSKHRNMGQTRTPDTKPLSNQGPSLHHRADIGTQGVMESVAFRDRDWLV